MTCTFRERDIISFSALFLRAKARDLLDKFELACEDLELAHTISPDNEQIANMLEQVTSKVPKIVEILDSTDEDSDPVETVDERKEDIGNSRIFKRLEIIEEDGESSDE